MNDDLSRDDLDAVLGRHLRDLGAGRDDTHSVLHAMGPRFVAAQRRRRAAIAAGALAAMVSVVGTAAALSGGGGPRVDTVPPAQSSAPDGGPVLTDDEGRPVPTDDDGAAGSSTSTGRVTDGTGTTAAPNGSTPPTDDTTVTTDGATATTRPDDGPGTTTPTTNPTTTDPTTTTAPGGISKTCVDPQGNVIQVRWNGSALSLLSATANTGAGWFRVPPDDVYETDRIRIRFENGVDGHRVTARWDGAAIGCS